MKLLLAFLASGLTFTILDYIWLGKIMKNFYLEKLASHIEIKDGSLVVNYPAAIIFYLLSLFTIYFFVVKNVSDVKTAIWMGALLGFCMYAFYDFTNLATLKNYPWSLAIIDTLWGTFLISITSVIMFLILN